MKILKKNSAYIIEIEQSEKETGRTMYNTRHELAKLITHKERLQSNWNSLREWLENLIDNFQEDVSTPILHEQMTIRLVYEYMENLDKMNELEGKK